jgi:hypothetical protein
MGLVYYRPADTPQRDASGAQRVSDKYSEEELKTNRERHQRGHSGDRTTYAGMVGDSFELAIDCLSSCSATPVDADQHWHRQGKAAEPDHC